MENRQNRISELAAALEEKGYGLFRFRYGRLGVDFGSGLADAIQRAEQGKYSNTYPVFASTTIHATTPDNPITIASFSISENDKKELQIDKMQISIYENIEAPLRTTIEIIPKSLEDIPEKHRANELIDRQWNEQVKKNLEKRRMMQANRNQPTKRFKLGRL